jgi:hypothetical protein
MKYAGCDIVLTDELPPDVLCVGVMRGKARVMAINSELASPEDIIIDARRFDSRSHQADPNPPSLGSS